VGVSKTHRSGSGFGDPGDGGEDDQEDLVHEERREERQLLTGVCICDRSRSWQASKQSNPTASAVVIEEDALSVGL
jgi:hypothetical protein